MTDALLGTRALRSLLGEWKDGSGPLYQALYDRIRLLVLDGRIPAGTRLPAERELAQALEVSRTLVTSAYRELREGGYTTSIRGSGSVTRVPGRAHLAVDAVGGFLDFTKAIMPASPGIALATQLSMDDFGRYLQGPGYNFEGIPELREAVAARYTARGLAHDTGSDPGDDRCPECHRPSVACAPRPGRPRARRAAQLSARLRGARPGRGATRAGERTPGEGWDESALEQLMRRTNPAVGYLMPDFHNPTGESMPAELRERTIDRATRAGYDAAGRRDVGRTRYRQGRRSLPFAAYATPGDERSVVTIGSVGKTIWDGLRVGWIRAEPGLIRTLAAAPLVERPRHAGARAADRHAHAPRHALDPRRAPRAVARGPGPPRADRRRAFPRLEGAPGRGRHRELGGAGFAVSSQLALAARAEGLLITAGPRFGLDGALERFLRIPLGYPTAQLDQGMDALARAWQAIMRNPMPGAQAFGDVA